MPLNASIALIHSQHQKASPPLSSSTLGTIIIVDLIGNYWAQPGFADPTCSQSILDRPHRPPLPVRLGDETNDDHSHTHTIILRSNSTHQYASAHILDSSTVTTTATATAGPLPPPYPRRDTLRENCSETRAISFLVQCGARWTLGHTKQKVLVGPSSSSGIRDLRPFSVLVCCSLARKE